MDSLVLRTEIEHWPLARPFRITGYTFNVAEVLLVSLEKGGRVGRGEAAGVYYKGDTAASMAAQIESLRPTIEKGIDRRLLQEILPPGGARNALDCALWDLEAKCSGRSIWDLTGITPRPLTTVFTIGIEDNSEIMVGKAIDAASFPILKIKVDADQPVERVAAIRAARPDAELIIDANQAWTFRQLVDVVPRLSKLRVRLIEQPLPRGSDDELEGYRSAIPLCADESCQHRGELAQASRRYQFINIKLDKAGGLTEALLLAESIRRNGLEPWQGGRSCGTSLSMAPAFVVAQLCRYAELDTQMLLKRDRTPSLHCHNGQVAVPDRCLWG